MSSAAQPKTTSIASDPLVIPQATAPFEWAINDYKLEKTERTPELNEFQAYILKMAAIDYVVRYPPPPAPIRLPFTNDEGDAYLYPYYKVFSDEHQLLLSWVLDRGFSGPNDTKREFEAATQAGMYFCYRIPLLKTLFMAAIPAAETRKAKLKKGKPWIRFSELPLPVELKPYSRPDSAGLSGLRLNVLWAGVKRYANMMAEIAGAEGNLRVLAGGPDVFYAAVQESRASIGAVYVEDVNIAVCCAINGMFEEFVFCKESNSLWSVEEKECVDKIRELFKDVIVIALKVVCEHYKVQLIFPKMKMLKLNNDDSTSTFIDHHDTLDVAYEPPNTKDSGIDTPMDNETLNPESNKDITLSASRLRLPTQAGTRPPSFSLFPASLSPPTQRIPQYTLGFETNDTPHPYTFTPLNATYRPPSSFLPQFLRPRRTMRISLAGQVQTVEVPERSLPVELTASMVRDYPRRINRSHVLQRPSSESKQANAGGKKHDWMQQRVDRMLGGIRSEERELEKRYRAWEQGNKRDGERWGWRDMHPEL